MEAAGVSLSAGVSAAAGVSSAAGAGVPVPLPLPSSTTMVTPAWAALSISALSVAAILSSSSLTLMGAAAAWLDSVTVSPCCAPDALFWCPPVAPDRACEAGPVFAVKRL